MDEEAVKRYADEKVVVVEGDRVLKLGDTMSAIQPLHSKRLYQPPKETWCGWSPSHNQE